MPLARLVVTEPFKPVSRVLIEQFPFVVGRGADCQLKLEHPSVSKHHASIDQRQRQFILSDLGSKNGTLVNGVPVASDVTLADEDLLRLGALEMVFETVPEERLAGELRADYEKLHSALQVTAAVTASNMLERILDQVMDGLRRLSQGDRGLLLMTFPGGEIEMVRHFNFDSTDWARHGSFSSSAVQRALETGSSVVISDTSADTYFADRGSVVDLNLRTLVCVPILDDAEEVMGVLYADSERRGAGFAEIDVEVLTSLAASAAIALQNARLNREIQQLMQQTREVLSQVQQVALIDESLQMSIQQTLTSLESLQLKGGMLQDSVLKQDNSVGPPK